MLSYISRITSRCHTAQRRYGTELLWTEIYSAAKRCASAHPKTVNFMLERSEKRWNSTARESGDGQPHVTYWSKFPEFDHNANAPIKEEFIRLAQLKDWIANDPRIVGTETQTKTYHKEWRKCIGSEFKWQYGHDDSSLAGWQSLCQEIGLENIPQSVEECREALRGKEWVNIVDLVDCRRTGSKAERFETEEALGKYTVSTERIFPLEEAKKNGFSTPLLINLIGRSRVDKT